MEGSSGAPPLQELQAQQQQRQQQQQLQAGTGAGVGEDCGATRTAVLRQDAFLVFRALCKLSTRTSDTAAVQDATAARCVCVCVHVRVRAIRCVQRAVRRARTPCAPTPAAISLPHPSQAPWWRRVQHCLTAHCLFPHSSPSWWSRGWARWWRCLAAPGGRADGQGGGAASQLLVVARMGKVVALPRSSPLLPSQPTLLGTARRGKVVALELLKLLLENTGPTFRASELFASAIRQHLCAALLRNSTSAVPAALQLSCSIFLTLLSKFRTSLKAEVRAPMPPRLTCGQHASRRRGNCIP